MPDRPCPAQADADNPLEKLLEQPLAERSSGPVSGTGAAPGVVLGRIVACDAQGVQICLPRRESPLLALSLCALSGADVGRTCAVLFTEGDPERPLIVGCIVDCVENMEDVYAEPAPAREVRVNGEKVCIESDTELELRCGESVILLQRNGVIEIRGNYVTSHARATQRIRGGSVHVN